MDNSTNATIVIIETIIHIPINMNINVNINTTTTTTTTTKAKSKATGCVDAVRLLLEARADANLESLPGTTPMLLGCPLVPVYPALGSTFLYTTNQP